MPASHAAEAATACSAGILALLDERANRGDAGAGSRAAELRDRTAAGEDLARTLRGAMEWAYVARADGSAQPFTVVFPPEPSEAESWAVLVELHGGGGTHERKAHRPLPGVLQLFVLGHGRHARYRGLAEADVGEVIEFAARHWPVDRRRLFLMGHSLGGAGSFSLASRHPDWFAGVVPLAGWLSGVYPENLLQVRLLAFTSRDDKAIHPLARAGLEAIATQNGQAAHWIANGLGHRWPPSDVHEALWSWLLKSPPIAPPKRFRYTAEDEAATGAWGVDVAVWGDDPGAAGFEFEREASHVKIRTSNVHRLRLRPSVWAHAAGEATVLEIDGVEVAKIGASETGAEPLFFERRVDRWARAVPADDDGRAHFPGGLDALLRGEPLVVVYGTRGEAAAVEARRRAAEHIAGMVVASTHPLAQRSHGRFRVVKDVEFDTGEWGGANVVLVGDAAENAIAARFAPGVPARIEGELVSAAGESWSLRDATVGVLGRDPRAPWRLLYWLVAHGARAYEPESLPFRLLGYDTRPAVCPDLLVVHNVEDRLVAARRLTGRWGWSRFGVEAGVTLGEAEASREGVARVIAEAIQHATGAEAGWSFVREPEAGLRVYVSATAGVTRREDLASLQGAVRVLVIEPTGEELRRLLDAPKMAGVLSGLDARGLEAKRRYRVACIGADAWALLRVIDDPELPLRATELDVAECLRP